MPECLRRLRSISRLVALSMLTALALLPAAGFGQARSLRPGDTPASTPPRCGTFDRDLRELLFGFPFDPSDCSASETNPSDEYDPGALYEIPVVVHILMDDSCTQGVVPDDLVHSQIEILNEDFLALPGTNGEDGTDAQIQFVLASEDPDGNPTDGITRDCNTTWFNDNGTYWNELAWDPHNYVNVYTNTAGGFLGYVPFLPADGGGGQVGQPHDRVVVLWEAFGRDAPIGPPYDQGRTLTHEVGHFLGLEHTFAPQGQCGSADPPGCYGDGDLICDTEVEQSPRFGCPVGAQSCSSPDPIHNYMDYSDDLCMEEFTLEQMRRNRCTLQFYRPELYNEVTEEIPVLSFDPTALDFGDVPVGETSAPQTSTLSNTGDADATGVVFSGLPASGFEADTSACGDTLPAGASCALSVTFTPAAPGPATASLHVDSAEGATADLGLSGNGVEDSEPPVIDVDPDSLASTLPEGGAETQPLTIANLGDETLEWQVTEDGAAGARLAPSAAYRSSGAASGARAARTSRTVVTVNEQGVFEAVDVGGSADDAAVSFAPAPVAGPAGLAHAFAQGTTLWSYDDADAIADGVAVDAMEAWGAWRLTGARLTAHANLGDGTPDFEFSSFLGGSSGVAAAKGADRIVFIEGNVTHDQYMLHGFTSQSAGTPDWTFEFPATMTGWLVNFRNVAVSYDGSTAAAIGHDTPAEEHTLYVFDAATGEVTFTWTDATVMSGVDLSDDGSIALVTQSSLATIIDTASGEILFQTPGSGAGSIYYDMSGDGNVLVVGGFDLDVYKHDGTTYQPVIEFTRPTSWFGQAAVVSRDGSTVGVLAGDYGSAYLETEAYIFDVATGELLGSQLFTGSGAFTGVAADAASSDDGSVVAFASWGTEFHDWPEVMVFNRDVEMIGEIAFPGSAFSVDVSADGQYVVGGSKAVHANEFGNGGRIELIAVEGGEPGDCVLPEWVSADPASGTVPAGGEQVVDVTFDATGLDAGTYEANLCLASNDPATPLVVVPLSLTVEGGGDGPIADITPESFAFEVPQGGGDSDTLNVGNLGGEDLIWSLDEAETALAAMAVSEGAPYRYGLAEMPAFNAPVGGDRASGTTRARGEAPADRVVLPAPQVQALGDFTEGFDDIQQLPGAGWAMINNSDPEGPSSWFQGNESIFPAHEGAPNAYIAANYESTADNGTISNWLITPEVQIVNGTEACFWTRKSDLFGEFLDRLEVRMSDEGASTDVGETADSVGDFTTLLLTIEPDLELPNEYPEEWTEFCVTVRERSREPVNGRFAFRYWVTESGPDGTNGDYIGIDTVSVTQPDDEPTPVGCDNPTDIPWLAADPTSGTTSPADSSPVTVTVDAASLDPGDYSAQLCVTTNDPAAPLVEVPVSLTVTDGGPPEGATFEALGDLPGGAFESYGRDISADGSVVVGMSTTADGSRGFRWEDGQMVDVGSLPGGSEFSDARDVSADGSAISGYTSSENGIEAFRWQDGVMTGLGDLPDGNATSLAFDISADGTTIVGWGTSAAGREAFSWEDGTMTGLGDLEGGVVKSEARAISTDGSTIVGAGTSANGTEAFRLAGGVMTPLGDLPSGGFNSVAHGVSADGAVVVGQSAVEFGEEAFRWEDGVMVGLGDLDGGTLKSLAYDVTADGSVIVGHGNTANGFEATVWTATDGLRNLREVLEIDYGLDLSGWQLWEAIAINDEGTAIAGYGTNPNGDSEAWRVLLPTPLGR